jgi:hypothetical protein
LRDAKRWHSFFKIAIPIAIAAVIATAWTDILRVFKYGQKKLIERKVRSSVFNVSSSLFNVANHFPY